VYASDDGGHVGHRESGARGVGRRGDVSHVDVTWYTSSTTAAAADAGTHGCTALIRHALRRPWTNQPAVRRRHDVIRDVTAGATSFVIRVSLAQTVRRTYCIYTVGHKKCGTFCRYLRRLLTDFQNAFAVALCRKICNRVIIINPTTL